MKNFSKNIENFICFNCKNEVLGNGYTNHCSNCLWSLHVDNIPGDRLNSCKGKMEPIGLKKHKKGFQIIHLCKNCGVRKNNKVNESDNMSVINALRIL